MEGPGLSQRRACGLVGIGHSTLRYQRRAQAAAGVGGTTPALRLSAAGLAAGARGPRHESQESLPALPRGTADGTPARQAQAGPGLAHPNDGSRRH